MLHSLFQLSQLDVECRNAEDLEPRPAYVCCARLEKTCFFVGLLIFFLLFLFLFVFLFFLRLQVQQHERFMQMHADNRNLIV